MLAAPRVPLALLGPAKPTCSTLALAHLSRWPCLPPLPQRGDGSSGTSESSASQVGQGGVAKVFLCASELCSRIPRLERVFSVRKPADYYHHGFLFMKQLLRMLLWLASLGRQKPAI